MTKETIHIVIQNGMVREIAGAVLPQYQFAVLDYDIEDAQPEELQISPLDGEPCRITKL